MSSIQQGASSLVCYSSDQIPQVWPLVRHHIARVLDHTDWFTLEGVYEELCSTKLQLWTSHNDGIEAAWITSIQTDDENTFCLILAAGGSNVWAWINWTPEYVEPWAKEKGAEEMRIYGRLGWARLLNYDIDKSQGITQKRVGGLIRRYGLLRKKL